MKLSTFLKQHFIWVGLCAVIIPLLVNLYLQYVSLSKLEETLPAARKVLLATRLNSIATDIQEFYTSSARQALNVPPSVFEGWYSEKDFEAIDRVIEDHFNKQATTGVKRFFVASVLRESRRTVVGVYNPATRKVESGPHSPESLSVIVATSPWIALMWQEARGMKRDAITDPDALIADEKDPENLMILKPVLDSASRMVGIAGVIIDNNYFKDTYLPEALRNANQKYFPDGESEDLILTVYDESGNAVTTTQAASEQALTVRSPLPFVFSKWTLAGQPRGLTHEQLARRQFIVSFSLAIVMTLALIGGVALAFRTASREMKLSQMKTDFVSNVSHELRTPLSSIRVFGEFQRLGWVSDPEKVRQYGKYIEAESRRLTQLIDNILDFSRIESGQKVYRFEKGDLGEVIAETLKTVEVRLQQEGFTVKVEPSDKPLPPVFIDPEAISQVLVNLLDNAVKYSGEAREIRVQLGRSDGYVTMSVTDQGIGIPVEEQQKIFDRFHRVGTGLVHDVKGSGLGLSLVKHMVEAHAGKVSVESELGRGSTFTVLLPVGDEASARAGAQSASTVERSEVPVDAGYKY